MKTQKYKLTVTYEFEAAGDPEARGIVHDKLIRGGLPFFDGTDKKLQAVQPNGRLKKTSLPEGWEKAREPVKKLVKKKKPKFRWECGWTNGKGCFNPDYEACNKKSRTNFDTVEAAIEAGEKHDPTHRWCGWGYAPSNWKNESVDIYCRLPNGKEVYLGCCKEAKKNAEDLLQAKA